MKNLMVVCLLLGVTFQAKASGAGCNNGALTINPVSVQGKSDVYEIRITDPGFIAEVKRKLAKGEVYYTCAGYCDNSSGWVTRSNNKLVSNTTLEVAQDGKETLKLSEMRSDLDYYGKVYFFGPNDDSSTVRVRGNGMDVIINSPSELTGSHTHVRYELQHWYFDSCK